MSFVELGGSLPCSQEPTTRPYHEPDDSSPYICQKITLMSSDICSGLPN
jgi:hypothetical protein